MRIAIIPARGGSKGVPRKNVRPVAGKPLIAWNIEAARNARMVDEVYVSTDDGEIAAISERYGAKVVRRPAEISGDTASSESALLHVIDTLAAQGVNPEEIVFMQCTSPLTASEDIDACVEKLEASGADSAFTAKEFFYFIWKVLPDGSCDGINHDKRFRPRRQDREPQYEENGAVYVMRTDGFLKAKHRFFGKTVMSLMPESRCFEIDTEFDLEVAGRILSERDSKAAARPFPSKLEAIVFDFDGVMTDDTVWTTTCGEEAVRCSREDGQGIARAKVWGVPMLILSTETNPVVAARAKKLGIDVIQNAGLKTKGEVLKAWLDASGISAAHTLFMGNDLNDIECMKMSGFSVAPASACSRAKEVSDIVLRRDGGCGAVRECLEFVSAKIGKPM